ncbi:MAG: DUF3793 family protein [Clostridiales bacterium]|nr:DUF3793 family protein [Clostridiales bacterium]
MFEEMLVFHCAPTLAGMKTGSMFSAKYKDESEMRLSLSALNRTLRNKGIRILPLRFDSGKALLYIYRPSKLKDDLCRESAKCILEPNGYKCAHPEKCIVHLISKMRQSDDFPHEIGLFLGYPPEDVLGFINDPEGCKCVGCWKVYSDVESARKLFAKYKKCTDVYRRHHKNGKTIEKLTVAV